MAILVSLDEAEHQVPDVEGPTPHGSLFIVCPDPRRSIIEVGREDSLGIIDHEEWRVASGPAGGLSSGSRAPWEAP